MSIASHRAACQNLKLIKFIRRAANVNRRVIRTGKRITLRNTPQIKHTQNGRTHVQRAPDIRPPADATSCQFYAQTATNSYGSIRCYRSYRPIVYVTIKFYSLSKIVLFRFRTDPNIMLNNRTHNNR